jgi:hypothetical protein
LIKNLTIQGFRGIKEGHISFSPITILLGSNNSGKSTILEALFLAPNPCRPVPYCIPQGETSPSSALVTVYFLHKTLDYSGYAFLLHNYTSKNAEIKIETGNSNDNLQEMQDKAETLAVNTNEHFIRFLKKDQYIYLQSSSQKSIVTEIEVNGAKVPVYCQLHDSGLGFNYAQSDAFTEDTLLLSPKLSLAGYEYLRRKWPEIVNSGISRRVAKDASELSWEHYMDFTMEPMIGGQLDLYAYLEDGRRIRLGDLGEGMQSYVLSRILCELRKPEVILWDDIESHLNPRMLSHIADWFGELVREKKQVVISTHSLEATKVIAGINEKDSKICITTIRNSVLKTKSLTLTEVEKLQESGIDARVAEGLML